MKRLRLSFVALFLVAGCVLHLAAQVTPSSQTQAVPGGSAAGAPASQVSTETPLRLGFLSYNAIFQLLPEYAQAQEQFQQLKEKYDAEAQRAEAEFQRKFSEFLQGQKDFPRSIMQKRQTELQNLMEQSVDFRQKAQQLLLDAQTELQQPARQRLDDAIRKVASNLGLICVINTDSNAAPFLAPNVCIDVTRNVLQELGIAIPSNP